MCFKTFFSHATYHVESNTHNEYFANANILPSWVENCLRVREVLPQVCNYGVEHFLSTKYLNPFTIQKKDSPFPVASYAQQPCTRYE